MLNFTSISISTFVFISMKRISSTADTKALFYSLLNLTKSGYLFNIFENSKMLVLQSDT